MSLRLLYVSSASPLSLLCLFSVFPLSLLCLSVSLSLCFWGPYIPKSLQNLSLNPKHP